MPVNIEDRARPGGGMKEVWDASIVFSVLRKHLEKAGEFCGEIRRKSRI